MLYFGGKRARQGGKHGKEVVVGERLLCT